MVSYSAQMTTSVWMFDTDAVFSSSLILEVHSPDLSLLAECAMEGHSYTKRTSPGELELTAHWPYPIFL